MRAGQTHFMKSDSHTIYVVFRTDSVSYSDIILRVSVLKIARLKWLGHLVGMEDKAPCGKTNPLPSRKQWEERKIQNKEARFRIKS